MQMLHSGIAPFWAFDHLIKKAAILKSCDVKTDDVRFHTSLLDFGRALSRPFFWAYGSEIAQPAPFPLGAHSLKDCAKKGTCRYDRTCHHA